MRRGMSSKYIRFSHGDFMVRADDRSIFRIVRIGPRQDLVEQFEDFCGYEIRSPLRKSRHQHANRWNRYTIDGTLPHARPSPRDTSLLRLHRLTMRSLSSTGI